MILWRLRFITAEVVCSIEKERDGYRLRVQRGEDIDHEEPMRDVREARLRAFQIHEQLVAMGFTSAA